jgi:hypothetical protein
MRIGDEVIYNGRRYAVVGVTPFSVKPFRVGLFDVENDDTVWVDWPPAGRPERAALRAVAKDRGDDERRPSP